MRLAFREIAQAPHHPPGTNEALVKMMIAYDDEATRCAAARA